MRKDRLGRKFGVAFALTQVGRSAGIAAFKKVRKILLRLEVRYLD
jgi:hypothetical protein